MQLDTHTMIGSVLAVIAHIGSIPKEERTPHERVWMMMADTAVTRLYRKVPPNLRDLVAQIDVKLGRLIADPEQGPEDPKEA